MQMQPQPQQANAIQATQGAMQQAQAPQEETTPEQTPEQGPLQDGGQDSFDSEILANLEQHLNTLDPKQQAFLASSLQHYANIVIPVLGIVCGPEVFDYFLNIYKQHFAKGAGATPQPVQQQPNSAPNPQQGQQPNQEAQAQAQPAPQQAPAQQPL